MCSDYLSHRRENMKKTWMRSLTNGNTYTDQEKELMETLIPDPIRVYDKSKGEFIWVPHVGSYGIFSNPIINYNGLRYVCEFRHIPSDQYVCRSHGCDYCDGGQYISCRNIIDQSECAYCF